MKRLIIIWMALIGLSVESLAFCGFYVTKADAKLFNKASSVIVVRDGTQTVITMSSDFQGDVKDFAMVVPVPVVLKRDQIRLAKQEIFDKLDAYSGPRLVEYHDQIPCMPPPVPRNKEVLLFSAPMEDMPSSMAMPENERDLGVTILEEYSVGEYDIMILSAKESDGLEIWLTRNGYKIPSKASDVLEPYIKSDMKFFVVKVNLDQYQAGGTETLRPIQMSFRSDRFGLPIRLGMANAEGDQDMIVYAFAKEGRVETANYRTVKIPTNQDVPNNLRNDFGQFYKDVFRRAWYRAGKNAVMLEYAWNLSGVNPVKCDPCVGPPPVYYDMREAGVFWLQGNNMGYTGQVYMTRLHVRYNRKTFPQDLAFQLTPNKEHFQGRYVMRNPPPAVKDYFTCDEGQKYLKSLHERRQNEVNNLVKLTGWKAEKYISYVKEYDKFIDTDYQPYFGPLPENDDKGFVIPFSLPNIPTGGLGLGILLALIAGMLMFMHQKYRKVALRIATVLGLGLMSTMSAQAFCGFYVAKADAKLFNKASAVIIARDGEQTVITMSSDFEGDVKDFAMVVPVPEVLKRNQIRLAKQEIFDKLDAYSGPRLVEYYDPRYCYDYEEYYEDFDDEWGEAEEKVRVQDDFTMEANNSGVTILERYTVGEYDILILSAEESDGLEYWLTKNGYKIPKGAADILEPYIKSDLKFFVVKVNLEALETGNQTLRPIQMSFRSERFGLPIRLGMANAEGDQDMIVYAFARNGRIETANYRTVKIPTDQDIPNNLQPKFGQFYKDLFDRAWAKAGKDAVMLEYAWNLGAANPVKCDPCVGPPPVYYDMREAGVFWIQGNQSGYTGEVYMTRLHVRYNRNTFPQDLSFQLTPNRENFQGRYVMRHPPGYYKEYYDCEQGQKYLKELHNRREKEVANLTQLTGWSASAYHDYITEYDPFITSDYQPFFGPLPEKNDDKGFVLPIRFPSLPTGGLGLGILLIGILAMAVMLRRKKQLLRLGFVMFLGLITTVSAQAFCGFYVAKADASLFNKASAAILVRDGDKTVITMSSDYEGDVEDFAMVVPVPEVLERNQIRIANANIFDKLDSYSAPRLVEYYDEAPCYQEYPEAEVVQIFGLVEKERIQLMPTMAISTLASGVKVEKEYKIDEYEILILSAKQSTGLEKWLKFNGYKIPEGAAEVLEPYIKSGMNFFVVKVDLAYYRSGNNQKLRPIQISFTHDRFGLPIRLGMANANGDQDMIIYAFAREGRIECTNYRTVEVPTNLDIPGNLKPRFGEFYSNVFDYTWEEAGKDALMLEYVWNLSGTNPQTNVQPVKCDPCVGPPPVYYDLVEAGVYWLNRHSSSYTGDVYLTRLHARYNRETFPQDLTFQLTPNKENFQGRYVMRHVNRYQTFYDCEEGQAYLKELVQRREKEVETLCQYTGWNKADYESYIHAMDPYLIEEGEEKEEDEQDGLLPVIAPEIPGGNSFLGFLLLVLISFALLYYQQQKRQMLRIASLTGLLLLGTLSGQAFCGFYVTQAKADIFNKASAVIIARDGNQTVVTMSSDFEGSVKNFAMVIPVPEVLARDQIRLAKQEIFDKLDSYSGPRLVQYFDQAPCYDGTVLTEAVTIGRTRKQIFSRKKNKFDNSREAAYGVTIVESYTVGEYDFVILSAEESDGLERWLTDNGYQIPKGAGEVLKPYIKSKLKFFVVKVNVENFERQGFAKLRPIQINYRSGRFMLPIRLGMANANGDQDMIVYAFARNGRIETANYRTVPIPTNWDIPSNLHSNFGAFYKDLFTKAWKQAGKNAVMLEYAWELDGTNPVKCDPCNGPPPVYYDMREAGVFWLKPTQRAYKGRVFMTRLHMRYNRETFPQDLKFILTPNRRRFQGRYVMHQTPYPANGAHFNCDEGQQYLHDLHKRREQEVKNLALLTNWNPSTYKNYVEEYDPYINPNHQPYFEPGGRKKDRGMIPFSLPFDGNNGGPLGGLCLLVLALGLVWMFSQYKPVRKFRPAFIITLLLLFSAQDMDAFCGFYVAKADAKLFNKSSSVIIARKGTQTVVTMSSDFEGEVKDFAMVIPVPEVLKRDQIRLADQLIFDKLDAYSGPRLVEYYDENPCVRDEGKYWFKNETSQSVMEDAAGSVDFDTDKDGVEILESYTVGEYDILILSASESQGLERWLIRNGYKIPAGAADILDPYIKSDLKFFVVKVNLESYQERGAQTLRPIQMNFRSERFGLPIRLGMANAEEAQDMIVYAFAEQGRIETANYRTVGIPTDRNVPLDVSAKFGEFYVALFDKAWEVQGRNAVMMEYAWDLSASNFVKCDPCPVQPPIYTDLREAGVFWLTQPATRRFSADYEGDVFLTRLHVRYDRETFPQDLKFSLTPNKENFQGRYILTHPASGDLTCDEGQDYIEMLGDRRRREVDELAALTDWDVSIYENYIHQYDAFKEKDRNFLLPFGFGSGNSGWWFWMLLGIGMGLIGWRIQSRQGQAT